VQSASEKQAEADMELARKLQAEFDGTERTESLRKRRLNMERARKHAAAAVAAGQKRASTVGVLATTKRKEVAKKASVAKKQQKQTIMRQATTEPKAVAEKASAAKKQVATKPTTVSKPVKGEAPRKSVVPAAKKVAEKEVEGKREVSAKAKDVATAQVVAKAKGGVGRKATKKQPVVKKGKAASKPKVSAKRKAAAMAAVVKKQPVAEVVEATDKMEVDTPATPATPVKVQKHLPQVGSRLVFRLEDSWQMGVVKSGCTKGSPNKSKARMAEWWSVAFPSETLVLKLTDENHNKDWVFLKDVASAKWRRGLRRGHKLEMLDESSGQWVAGKVAAVDGAQLVLEASVGKGGGCCGGRGEAKAQRQQRLRFKTSRSEGINFAPPHTFIAQQEDQADDGHSSLCSVCGLGGEMLMCDGPGCPHVCHLACAHLDQLPAGDWFCPTCTECNQSHKKKRSRKN